MKGGSPIGRLPLTSHSGLGAVPSANSAGVSEKSFWNDDSGFITVPPSPCGAAPRASGARCAQPAFVGMSIFSSIGVKPV